ncbi:uncharacterized protein [Littorina saxatilis]|uniref:uncharacterized protein n=1 Tax=Littorina saxatilis TaxID=31220 RepID=UPI0038B5D7F6
MTDTLTAGNVSSTALSTVLTTRYAGAWNTTNTTSPSSGPDTATTAHNPSQLALVAVVILGVSVIIIAFVAMVSRRRIRSKLTQSEKTRLAALAFQLRRTQQETAPGQKVSFTRH